MTNQLVCNLCGSIDESMVVSEVKAKPALETDYGISEKNYFRRICLCKKCSAYYNSYAPDLLPADFYNGFYNSSIDSGELVKRFNRIVNLPFEQSDNKYRVKRITDFLTDLEGISLDSIELLDVGTGTGVFLHEAKKFIRSVNCVDPDPHSIELVKKLISVSNAWVGSVEDIPDRYSFDFISFNKVLEHVPEPVNLLKNSILHLNNNGIIYIELPYSEIIIVEGKQIERAEFFVEHLVIYNHSSLAYLIKSAGMKSVFTNVVIEPSGKHSIFAFCKIN